MLTEKQSEGLNDLLDAVRGCEESDNRLRREELKKVASLMLENELTKKQRLVLLLLYGDNLTGRQVAERLGIRETAVSNLKKRALLRLRRVARYTLH